MKRKLPCLLLAFILLFSLFVTACATDDPIDDTSGNPDTDTTDSPDISDDTAPEDVKILPDLPAMNFDGAEFHCLHWNLDSFVGGHWMPWEEMDVDGQTGDLLSDQVYARNSYVEETYNVSITSEYGMSYELPNMIRAAVSTSDDIYQIMIERSGDISSMWTEGLFMNLRGDEMQYLDLEKPWWNQKSLDAFTFGGVTQFAASEMLLMDKAEANTLFFSTTLQHDYDLPNFYQLVEDGEWTWEALREAAEIVTNDLNGDDVMDANDQWGSCGNRGPLQMLYYGSGYSYGEIDEDGYLTTTLLEDEQIDFIIEIHEEMIYQDSHAHADVIPEFNIINKFMANEVLFAFYGLKMVNSLREMDSNYGILPIPKYDKYQENYRHLVGPDGDSIMGVPLSCGDTDLTSCILEALSAESYYTVYPAFYDVLMMGRYARDAETRDMLKLIFDTRSYDIGLIYGYDQVCGQLATYAAEHYGDSNLASFFASKASVIESSIKKLNDMIDLWNE